MAWFQQTIPTMARLAAAANAALPVLPVLYALNARQQVDETMQTNASVSHGTRTHVALEFSFWMPQQASCRLSSVDMMPRGAGGMPVS
jgi:hypothetical protein